jgi:Tol biopolymer transport system component
LVTLALIGATILTWKLSRGVESPPQLKQARLTARDLPVLNAAISPDGKYLGYEDQLGIHLQLVDTGEPQDLPVLPGIDPAKAHWVFGAWYPDSTRFIASIATSGKPATLWSVPIRGGAPEKLAEVEDMVGGGKISPDGSHIVYGRRQYALGAREIWLMGARGESPHKILTAESQSAFGVFAWSPAGNRIAYSVALQQGDLLVQSADLSGGNQSRILQDNALLALAWIAPGRLIYSRSTQRGSARAGDLWELSVDQTRGAPHGKPRRLTDWSGFSIHHLTATADGKRLAFLRSTHHASAYVGDLAGNGNRLVNPYRLTLDDNINIVLAWTPDSREVIFSSQRAATRQIYRQSLGQGSAPQPITSQPGMNFYAARLSPYGAWVVLEGERAGGVPQLLFHVDGLTQFWCTNKTVGFCVLGRPDPASDELAISSFDPVRANRKNLLRIPLEPGTNAGVGLDYAWQISPDGSRIAIAKRHENKIRLVPLQTGQARTIPLDACSDLVDLNWAVDSGSLFVSCLEPGGATLLHLELTGRAQPIWLQPQTTSFWGLSSPDARHLAISAEARETSVWMFGNF